MPPGVAKGGQEDRDVAVNNEERALIVESEEDHPVRQEQELPPVQAGGGHDRRD